MKVSILGATGSVGAPTAFYLAMSGLVDELLMIGGRRQNILEHHAIDISTAAAETDTKISHGSYEDLSGTDIVINVAGAHMPLHLDRNQVLQKQAVFIADIAGKIKKHCPEAAVITGVNPIDSLNYAMYLTCGINRFKLIGYSINDSIRFREALARELQEDVKNVTALVAGEHGPTQVPLFSSAMVNGQPAVLSEISRQRIRSGMFDVIRKYESLQAGRTAGWTCAVGLTTLVKAMIQDDITVYPCSVVLEGEYGQSGISMSVPVRLGKGGVKEIIEYELTPDELQGIAETSKTLKTDAAVIAEALRAE